MEKDRATGTLWELAYERLTSFSSGCAVSMEQGNLSFPDLLSAAEEIANSLRQSGLRQGEIALLALPNTAAFVPAFLSLAKLSVTAGLVPAKYSSAELSAIIEKIRPVGILATTEFAASHESTFAPLKWQPASSHPVASNLRFLKLEHPPSGEESEYAVIKFTSGSSGTPKAIPMTVGNIIAESRAIATTLSLTSQDKILVPVPLSHSYGFDLGLLAMLTTGATILPREGFIPRKTLREIASRDVTIVLGVPSMYRLIVETSGPSVPDLSHLRYLLSCTAPLHSGTIEVFHDRFGVSICQHYGSSETGSVTTHLPSMVLAKKESVGNAMSGVELRILDERGAEQPAGVEGEIVVAGGAVSDRYLMGMPAGRSPFREGKYWTGDFGVMDADRFLTIRGRIDGLINVGGFKVSPLEVVTVLESHNLVREAAVTGVRDSAGEEFVYAAVTLRNSVSERDLIAFCRSRLAEYKVPRRIELRESLPRGGSGKVILRPEDLRL